MNNKEILELMLSSRLIAILRKVALEDIEPTAGALREGGVIFQEVTFCHESGAFLRETVDAIARIRRRFEGEIFPGAGTVLTPEQVDMAVDAGAEYIVSPNVNFKVIERTKQRGKISIPGAFSPTEIVSAYEAGADIIKVFPASTLGPGYFKAIKSALGHIPLFAVGGVDEKNIAMFLEAGASGVAAGGNLVSKSAIREKNFQRLTETAQEYFRNIK